MSKALAHLLNQPELTVKKAINILEDLSGYPSEDVRLLAEMHQKARLKHTQLNLDPDDTTGQELHHALRARFENDSRRFSAALDSSQLKSSDDFSRQLIGVGRQAASTTEVLALKRSVAKDLLREMPPKRLMRQLSCRSLDSMLKHHNIFELYGGLEAAESDHWLADFSRLQRNLEAGDFENRKIEFIAMSVGEWKTQSSQGKITALPLLGIVIIWPTNYLTSQVILAQNISLIQAISQLQVYSFFLKHHILRGNFGRTLFKVLTQGLPPAAQIANIPISWRAVQKHLRDQLVTGRPMLLEPNLQLSDLGVHSVVPILTKLCSDLGWWHSNNHLAVAGKKRPVSLHLFDVLSNYSSSHPYEKRSAYHFQTGFWQELIKRYLSYEGVQNYIFNQLSTKQLAPVPQNTKSALLANQESFKLAVRS